MIKSNIKSIRQSVTKALTDYSITINLLSETVLMTRGHFVTNIYLQEPRTVQTFAAVETAEPSSAVVELSVEPLCLSSVSL